MKIRCVIGPAKTVLKFISKTVRLSDDKIKIWPNASKLNCVTLCNSTRTFGESLQQKFEHISSSACFRKFMAILELAKVKL